MNVSLLLFNLASTVDSGRRNESDIKSAPIRNLKDRKFLHQDEQPVPSGVRGPQITHVNERT